MRLAVILSSRPQHVGVNTSTVSLRDGNWRLRCVGLSDFKYTLHTPHGIHEVADGLIIPGGCDIKLECTQIGTSKDYHSIFVESF